MGGGDAYENWKYKLKEKAIVAEKSNLTERYDKLCKP
jgi:hypothetical protein